MTTDMEPKPDGMELIALPQEKALQHLLGALNWTYERVMDGIPGMDGVEDFANSYRASAQSTENAIDSLVRWQIGKASMAGFVMNLGGVVTLPIAVPANLFGALYVQTQMVAAIAHLRGYDVRSDKVRTLVIGCLIGDQLVETLKLAGITVGKKLAGQAINRISGAALTKINQAIGMRLLTKAGMTGVFNLGKLVPLVGGVIGGTIDGVMTTGIATVAKRLFVAIDAMPEHDQD